MEQDPIHRHKDVLSHTIAVVAKTEPEITVRLAALFHDIAKPRTRSFEHGGVTFRHHEVVGARMARTRLTAMGYSDEVVDDVLAAHRIAAERAQAEEEAKKRARAPNPLSCRKPQKARNPHSEGGGDKKRRKRRRKAKE